MPGHDIGHDIIVVGASAGGVEALITLVRGLPADLPAAVFVVLRMPADSPSAYHRYWIAADPCLHGRLRMARRSSLDIFTLRRPTTTCWWTVGMCTWGVERRRICTAPR